MCGSRHHAKIQSREEMSLVISSPTSRIRQLKKKYYRGEFL
jgi:hypothetical protein